MDRKKKNTPASMAAVFSGLNTTQLHRTNAAAADWLQSLINADGFVIRFSAITCV